MIKFILPGFYEHFNVYQTIIWYWEKLKPEYFKENISIGAVYGNFQFCTWDGGRVFDKYAWTSQEKIIEIRDFFNSRNIPIRFIYTNPILSEKDFLDRYGHVATSLCYSPLNEIVINNSNFENFMREKYPDFKYISSTTKCLTNPEDALQELKNDKYFMVCLDYNLNHNKEFLSNIPEEIKPKVEFLSNAICAPGCQFRKDHYRLNGISHLNAGRRFQVDNCQIDMGIMALKTSNYVNNLSPTEIYDIYYPMGFENFKLEGRTLPDIDIILMVAKYMVKPEYQFEFIEEITQQAWVYNYENVPRGE